MLQTLRAFEPAYFPFTISQPQVISFNVESMSRLTLTYHPVATAYAEELVRNHQAAANILSWSGWFCPSGQRTWIALEEMGLPYQYKEVNPYLKEKAFLGMSEQSFRDAIMNY